jgi:hypothetical protein
MAAEPPHVHVLCTSIAGGLETAHQWGREWHERRIL